MQQSVNGERLHTPHAMTREETFGWSLYRKEHWPVLKQLGSIEYDAVWQAWLAGYRWGSEDGKSEALSGLAGINRTQRTETTSASIQQRPRPTRENR